MPRWSTILTILFLLYTSLFFLHRPHLTTLDLGRHLVNGREIVRDARVLTTNFYSHTAPHFAVVNHHWLFGWLAYQVFRVFSFPGLVLTNTLLTVGAIFLVMLVARKQTDIKFALLASLLVFPLLVDRTDIRPETISIFLVALWIFLLSHAKQHNLEKILITIAITQVIWVNSHIFFVFGWLIAGAFLLRALVVKEFHWQRLRLLIFCTSLPLLSLFNPSGLAGVLEPFTIFSTYNYPVAENQSIWFFFHYSPLDLQYWYAAGLIVLALLSGVAIFHKKKLTQLPFVLTTFALALLAFRVSRVTSFFGLAFIPTLSLALEMFWQKFGKKLQKILNHPLGLMTISALGFGIFMGLLVTQLFTPKITLLGLGVEEKVSQSGAFLRSIKTSGTIFNNYDIGSYLIYTLFPEQRVFIDNRPEAYSPEFLQNDYIAAQQHEEIWKQIVQKYGIGVIFFAYRDATDWAGPFIIRRVQDPHWVPIYADSEVVILVIDIPEHQEIIEKYRVDPGVFRW